MTDAERIKELELELSFYRPKGGIGYYYELNRWVNGTVDMMRKSGVQSLLTPSKDEDNKKFEKMMALIKNTKEWIDNMEELKQKFELTGDEAKDKASEKSRITPESMAANLGGAAGQK